jgi:exodeoxyribonuclease VII large subunit
VSNFTKHQSGHMYFHIRDGESVLACVFFRRLNAGLKFQIQDGMHVLCFGRISVYDKRGQYQLYVERVEPKGAGALHIAFEQLKERLKKEGLFAESHKRPIPYLPQRVGVITSPTGAAIRDILTVAGRRFSNIEIMLNPVTVQGDTAKYEIVEAIKTFNERFPRTDVIILGRGGGSLEDLWPFNEEIVARGIYESAIPVISAVGHEVDWTISDFVADFRAPTPSAAAELVIPRKEELVLAVKGFSDRLRASLLSKIDLIGEKLQTLSQRYVFREPFAAVTQYEQEMDGLAEELVTKEKYIVTLKKEQLNTLAGKLDALSPLNILNRGYSITLKEQDGRVVRDAGKVKQKERIRTKVAHGEIVSIVERTG